MWSFVLYIFLVSLTLFLLLATLYLLMLALAYLIVPAPLPGPDRPLNKFAILVPAHNEELLIENLCESLLQIDYPKGYFEVFVTADNCSDRTVEVCRKYPIQVMERFEPDKRGKGQALAWALRNLDLNRFDAVLIVDADNYVDTDILYELSRMLNSCEQAIQCYNAVGNRDDSWFTQLLYVSRLIGNEFYHEAKYRLGLSSYLMGNGLCFQAKLLQRKGWTAFTAGEDWEYYAQLIEDNVKVAFADKAKVYHQESRSLNQATSQRLRWSSGRFRIAKTLGIQLFLKGIRERNLRKVDASLPLLFPNYSLQVSLSVGTLGLALLLPSSGVKNVVVVTALSLIACQFLLFLAGAVAAGSSGKVFRAVLYVPVFLIWKSVIDILCFTGLYRGRRWVRTRRHRSQSIQPNP